MKKEIFYKVNAIHDQQCVLFKSLETAQEFIAEEMLSVIGQKEQDELLFVSFDLSPILLTQEEFESMKEFEP